MFQIFNVNCEFSLFNESMTKSESEYEMCMYGSLDHDVSCESCDCDMFHFYF